MDGRLYYLLICNVNNMMIALWMSRYAFELALNSWCKYLRASVKHNDTSRKLFQRSVANKVEAEMVCVAGHNVQSTLSIFYYSHFNIINKLRLFKS